jgi:hypothetical protein
MSGKGKSFRKVTFGVPFTMRILVNSDPFVCDLCPNQPLLQLSMQLHFVWTKMKSALISSIFNYWAKIDKNVIFFTIDDMVHGILDAM